MSDNLYGLVKIEKSNFTKDKARNVIKLIIKKYNLKENVEDETKRLIRNDGGGCDLINTPYGTLMLQLITPPDRQHLSLDPNTIYLLLIIWEENTYPIEKKNLFIDDCNKIAKIFGKECNIFWENKKSDFLK